MPSKGLLGSLEDLQFVSFDVAFDEIDPGDPLFGEKPIQCGSAHLLNNRIPLISGLLSKDAGGRLPITTESTMVVN